jgi:NTP pyrophosphatase (non-canonical NTP hydrolase)
MDLEALTRKMNALVESKGWYKPDSLRPQTPRNLAISLNLEAAEVLEHFQWSDQFKDTKELANELADVLLYLLQLADGSGIDLEKAVLDKIDINHKRTWDDREGERE